MDTFGGTVHVEWDPDAGDAAGSPGVLRRIRSGRFDALVADCPLHYTSPNAPSKRDVLGTVLLSALAGQWRYAHITALRGDRVNPSLLGMSKVASEDSVRRGLERIEAEDGTSWLHGHLDDTVRPLLSEPRHDDQASLRPPGGGGCELQPEEAGPSLARLPCVPDGGHAPCAGR